MTDTEFSIEVKTLVDETDLTPWVILQVNATQHGREYVVTALKLTPTEARGEGFTLVEAAEAADTSANLVLSMRENKVPEAIVMAVLARIRERRGRK